MFVTLGKTPATLLIVAGAVNGLILPVGFAALLIIATFRVKNLLQGYEYPAWLLIVGWISWAITVYLGVKSMSGIAALWAG